MSEEIFKEEKIITQNDVENKQLKEENEQLRKENEQLKKIKQLKMLQLRNQLRNQ